MLSYINKLFIFHHYINFDCAQGYGIYLGAIYTYYTSALGLPDVQMD